MEVTVVMLTLGLMVLTAIVIWMNYRIDRLERENRARKFELNDLAKRYCELANQAQRQNPGIQSLGTWPGDLAIGMAANMRDLRAMLHSNQPKKATDLFDRTYRQEIESPESDTTEPSSR